MNERDGASMLLECSDWVEVELAERLLAEAGIPCARGHGVLAAALTTFGYLPRYACARYDLLVPTSELERARGILAAAWTRRDRPAARAPD